MADEESELYLENLDEFVNDEDKIVTYKWLSRTLSVPANKAKQMLYAFVQKQRASHSPHELNITYFIGGRCVADEDTVKSKKTFSVVTSLHIYSVQRCKLKDSNSLYTVDYDIQQKYKSEGNDQGNRWSHICCPSAKRLTENGIHRGVPASGTEQKSKALDAKTRKGQMSAIDMFAVKASTSKPEKSSSKRENATQERKVEPKAAETLPQGNKSGSKKSFFGKHSTGKVFMILLCQQVRKLFRCCFWCYVLSTLHVIDLLLSLFLFTLVASQLASFILKQCQF
ncbi:DNA polymerase delta subunit 3 [Acropora cervicornis]|uniref:DNA polymerase delta subunit 3 n=1 Tax=Acropora cervicornis TaxID=6130 RepID=A0AAD9QSF1_ACRCE|nr:DNA polymerase delta subunit 3 [Acropora cervicornis]